MTNSGPAKSGEFAKKTFKAAVWTFPSLSTSLLRFFSKEEIKEPGSGLYPVISLHPLGAVVPKGGASSLKR